MIFKAITDVFEIAPPVMFGGVKNSELPAHEQMVVGTRGLTYAEQQALMRAEVLDMSVEPRDKVLANKWERQMAKAKEKFAWVKNCRIERNGQLVDVTDFETWCQVMPPELVAWYLSAIGSGETLSQFEVKNYLRGSASPSTKPMESAGAASSAMIASETSATATTENGCCTSS